MGKCYVKAYYDWIEQTAALSDAERGRLFIAILEYARTGIPPELEGAESILFPVFRTMLDRDDDLSAERARNGTKGGKRKQVQAKSSKPKQTQMTSSLLRQRKKTKTKKKKKTYSHLTVGARARSALPHPHWQRFSPTWLNAIRR